MFITLHLSVLCYYENVIYADNNRIKTIQELNDECVQMHINIIK